MAGPPANVPRSPLGVPTLAPASENLLAVAWRSRWLILVCTILAVAAGFVNIQTDTPIYTSTSSLYLEYVNIVPLTSELGRLPQTERYLQTQA